MYGLDRPGGTLERPGETFERPGETLERPGGTFDEKLGREAIGKMIQILKFRTEELTGLFT